MKLIFLVIARFSSSLFAATIDRISLPNYCDGVHWRHRRALAASSRLLPIGGTLICGKAEYRPFKCSFRDERQGVVCQVLNRSCFSDVFDYLAQALILAAQFDLFLETHATIFCKDRIDLAFAISFRKDCIALDLVCQTVLSCIPSRAAIWEGLS
jgi:hypothetical protein